MKLVQLGWHEHFQNEMEKLNDSTLIPARVIRENKGFYELMHQSGQCNAQVSGHFRFNTLLKSEYPAVGDWVMVKLFNEDKQGMIHHVLERKSVFVRKASISGGRKVRNIRNREIVLGGSTEQQVVAANIDYVFIVTSADENFNLQRLERYIFMAKNSGAKPILVINKIDKADNPDMYLTHLDVPTYLISALNKKGLEQLSPFIRDGITIAFIGSSGVGKSTLINHFLNSNTLETGSVRNKDDKGRHTTTWRELVLLPTGGLLIDTPGMRELQIWSDMNALEDMYDDIKSLEAQCQFKNCSHTHEPNCAIKEALDKGDLDKDRYENYLIMIDEIHYLEGRKEDHKKLLTKRGILQEKIQQKLKNHKY